MVIEKGNSNAMNNLAVYYDEIEKNYKEAIKYYLMAIEKGDSDAMFNLAVYYDKIEKNYKEAIKYYLMLIEKGDYDATYNLNIFLKNKPLEIFNILIKIENPTDFILNLLNELKKNEEIIIFINKKRLFERLLNIITCPICFELKLNINLYCGHEVCIDCYLKCCNNN